MVTSQLDGVHTCDPCFMIKLGRAFRARCRSPLLFQIDSTLGSRFRYHNRYPRSSSPSYPLSSLSTRILPWGIRVCRSRNVLQLRRNHHSLLFFSNFSYAILGCPSAQFFRFFVPALLHFGADFFRRAEAGKSYRRKSGIFENAAAYFIRIVPDREPLEEWIRVHRDDDAGRAALEELVPAVAAALMESTCTGTGCSRR